MRSISASPEPTLVSLVPLPPEAEQVPLCSGLRVDIDEPEVAVELDRRDDEGGSAATSSSGSRRGLFGLLAVVVGLHLFGLWLLDRPDQQEPVETEGGPVYRVSLTQMPAAPSVDTGGVERLVQEQAAAAARAQAEAEAAARAEAQAQAQAQARAEAEAQAAAQARAEAQARARREAARQTQGAERPGPAASSPPSARELIRQATQQGYASGWNAAADRFARGASSSAERSAEARYIADWTRATQRYIDSFGRIPPGLDGRLVISVTIGRDGGLRDLRVVQSSGKPELDRIALDIVRASGSFRPFDRELGNRNELSFTRSWLIGQGSLFGVR
ncbi:energy transducer TonB [Halotalea alkalilenta]|uniref:energy transducer TonB n=1 Tax=Halotalea alkalilenta TaxID=376489 RepID=UPI000489FF3C|nr:TonB family protein [Halotalea alkalilenta]